MKKTKRIFTIIALICSFCWIISGVGVYAVWTYFADVPSTDDTVSMTTGQFGYKVEEVVPGGDHQAILGQNHLVLIDLILNEDDKGYGLNINDNVLLHQYLKRQKVVYCNQKTSGGNLKFILDPSNNTHGLYYCIEKVSDTEYHNYTYSVQDLIDAEGTNNEITTYKTIFIKTDEWRATLAYQGKAQVITLSSQGVSATSGSEPYAIDVTTWHI